MRLLAEFVIKSRSRALGAAVATAFVPFLSIISAAIIALIWLRMGRREGLFVLFWAALPGFYYLFTQGSPDVLLALTTAGLLADILRSTQRWSQVLLLGTALAGVVAFSYQWLAPDIQDEFIRLLITQGGVLDTSQLSGQDQQRLESLLALLLNGVITAVQLLMVFVSLFLARWWQASLYNPGGFKEEFHWLRLPAWYSGLMIGCLLAVMLGFEQLMAGLPVLVVPLLLSGLALVHGVVAIKQYNTFWLGMLYVLLLFALPYLSVLLILIAMADSLMNFRHRLAPPPPPNDGGHGDA